MSAFFKHEDGGWKPADWEYLGEVVSFTGKLDVPPVDIPEKTWKLSGMVIWSYTFTIPIRKLNPKIAVELMAAAGQIPRNQG